MSVKTNEVSEYGVKVTKVPAWVRKTSAFFNGLPQWAAILVVIVTVLTTWQLLVVTEFVSAIILPPPTEVAKDLWFVTHQIATGGFLAKQLGITVVEILIGFSLACIGGFIIGLWVGLSEFGRKAIMPLFVVFEAAPKIAFAPVFLAWFGFGMESKYIMAAFMSIFPVIIGTISGLAATTEDELKLFQSMRSSAWNIFWKLRIHRALPFIFAGLKIAVVSAVTGVVAAEFIGGGIGFGEQVRVAASRIDISRVFALIIFLSLLGLILFTLVSWLQRWVTAWDMPPKKTKKKKVKKGSEPLLPPVGPSAGSTSASRSESSLA